MSARRRLLVVGATAAAVGLLAGGWFLAAAFESPDQREARVAPPSPGPITAKVEKGDLSETVSLQGTVERDDKASVPLPAQTADEAVVTRVTLTPGTKIVAGTAVTEINGRPVLALPGGFRFYRSLTVGDTGPDVRQLQAGLAASGSRLHADGIFGPSTADAIKMLYAHAGYPPPSPPSPDAGPDGSPAAEHEPLPLSDTKTPTVPPVPPLILPKSEVAAFGALPAFLSDAPLLGTAVTDETAIAIQRGAPRVIASVPKLIAEKLHPGITGTFRATPNESIGVAVEAVKANGPDADSTVILGATDAAALGDEWLSKAGTAQLDVKLAAKDSLIVPTLAVSPGGKGSAHVLVKRKDGDFRRVAVTEIAQLNGRSAITPAEADSIRVDDLVRVD